MTDKWISNVIKRRSVFLSYAHADHATAQLLTMRLQDAGVDVWLPTNLRPGDAWQDAVERRLSTSDFFIALVSSAALASRLFQKEVMTLEFMRDLSDRSITVIPILLDDVELPDAIRHIQHIDFRANPRAAIEELVSRLETVADIDFSALAPRGFEDLVADLLLDLGFKIEREIYSGGKRFDLRIVFDSVDPFGGSVGEEWLIEVKHYSSGRLSVAEVSEFANIARFMRDQGTRIALVTSSQVTSAAREMIRQTPLRLVEGVELKRILLTRPELVRRHLFDSRRK